jgi:hypothetical protein
MKLIRLRNKRPVIAAPVPIPALAPVERDEDLLIVEVEYGMVVVELPMTEVASGVVGTVLRVEAVWTFRYSCNKGERLLETYSSIEKL